MLTQTFCVSFQQDPRMEGVDGHDQWSNHFWKQICWLEDIEDQIIIILAHGRKATKEGVDSRPPDTLKGH
jgi:hypothetical protein